MPQSDLGILALDPWLAPYGDAISWRRQRFFDALSAMTQSGASLAEAANGHLHFGIHPHEGGWVYREWAPGAVSLSLIGDFNGWARQAHPLSRTADGTWEIYLPGSQYARSFVHGSKVKVHVVSQRGAADRISPYARRVVQDPATLDFAEELWLPKQPFRWTDAGFQRLGTTPPLIYEAHPGMAQERQGVGTYREFTDLTLPRIARAGYNAVQLMAVAEHPYYASFGYQVANFFAPSSRFGTPDELKALVDRAHALGLAVFMDVVHAHAAPNVREGLSGFDGTDFQFFHAGARGDHPAWGSKVFDYGKPEVRHFLLSNLKYWLTEFHFDGFRFDGVTSMLYLHHGLGPPFDHYDRYFGGDVDADAVTYLQLANHLVHTVRPGSLTIAEDVSGMPGLGASQEDGGFGFDYRLAMGLPDFWFHLARTRRDEEWLPSAMLATLANRRNGEKHVAYVESHDQALVGDKTFAFTLMDSAMYWHMRIGDPDVQVDRGLALVKLVRLLTLAAGGDGYLNFMGNEFGHPEWIDFPREGNGWSYRHACRQWSLVDNPELRYQQLGAFDRAMLGLADAYRMLHAPQVETLLADDQRQLLAIKRAGMIFAFNFHPAASQPDLALPCGADLQVLLDSDQAAFGGHGRIDGGARHPCVGGVTRIYLPCRTAAVYGT